MSDRTTMKQTVEQIAFADSTYWDDGWQFADHLQQKARNGLAREPAFRLRTAAEHLMADPDYNRMTDVERVAWLKGWDAAIEAEQRILALIRDERDSFKRLMLVAGGRVAALEEGLRRIADYDIGLPVEDESPIVFDYYRTIVRKARALLAPAALPAEADPWCRIDEPHTHGGTDEYGPHLFGSQRGER